MDARLSRPARVGDTVRLPRGSVDWSVVEVTDDGQALLQADGRRRVAPLERLHITAASPDDPRPRPLFLDDGTVTEGERVVRCSDRYASTVVEWDTPLGDGAWADCSAVELAFVRDHDGRPFVRLSLAGGWVTPAGDRGRPLMVALGRAAAAQLAAELTRLGGYLR